MGQSPRSVTQVSKRVESCVACSCPQSAALESMDARAELPRASRARMAISRPPPIIIATAAVSARPVTRFGSVRICHHVRSTFDSSASLSGIREGRPSHPPRARGGRTARPISRPATRETRRRRRIGMRRVAVDGESRRKVSPAARSGETCAMSRLRGPVQVHSAARAGVSGTTLRASVAISVGSRRAGSEPQSMLEAVPARCVRTPRPPLRGPVADPRLLSHDACRLGCSWRGAMIGLGFLLVDVVLPVHAIGTNDEAVNGWLAAHRTPTLSDASYVGSSIGDIPFIPALVILVGLGAADPAPLAGARVRRRRDPAGGRDLSRSRASSCTASARPCRASTPITCRSTRASPRGTSPPRSWSTSGSPC